MPSASPLDPELDRWIAQFRGPLVGLLASWGADWRSAEELAMDTFAEAWLARERLRADRSSLEAVGAWLRGIAQNLLRGHRRKLRRAEPPPGHDDLHAIQAGESPDSPPDDRHELLRASFPKLRPEHQEVLRMHYLEETTAREVAALLGVTQKTIEMRLYQARRALRHFAGKAQIATGVER